MENPATPSRRFLWGVALLSVLGLLLALGGQHGPWSERSHRTGRASKTALLSFENQAFTLEQSTTPEERRVGLGGRTSLCARCGMLFVFPEAGRHAFWMEGMRFPLDIIWLSGDQVVHIERAVPAAARETFAPPVPADRVIELNAGAAASLEVGERVELHEE